MSIDSDEEFSSNLLSTLLINDHDDPNPNPNPNPSPQPQHHHLHSSNSSLLIRQLPSQGLSFQLWPAASTLVSLLDLSPQTLTLTLPPHPRILELGSGTGLVGLAAAALGAHVTLTDLPHVLSNLHFNAASNAPAITAAGGSVAVRQLSWGNEEDWAELTSSSPFDVVMASDVVYYEELIEPLMRTLRWAVKGEVGFVMAHLRRWKKRDALFFRKARRLFEVEVVHKDPPLEGSRVGVVVYRFKANKKKNDDDDASSSR